MERGSGEETRMADLRVRVVRLEAGGGERST